MSTLPADSVIIHEGYLFKTPPLDRFFVNWKKRWFVLSKHNGHNDLTYYSDSSKKEKKSTIDIRMIKKINPVHSHKTKDNVFSMEMDDGRKFVLKSPDKEGKSVWVAKLLECTKDGSAYHVTVPTQPTAQFAQCIVKLNTPLKVNVVSSFDGSAVMSIPFDRIRRFGCQVAVASDIVWFETCSCHEDMEEFQFFVVALGIEKAYQIVQEYKRSMELALRQHMVLEEGDQSQYQFSYIVKNHYGHTDYPSLTRERILQSGLLSLSTSGGALSLDDLNKFARSRQSLPSVQVGPVPGSVTGGRKLSNATLLTPGMRSPSPSPSPTSPQSRMTLDQFQKSPRSSRSSSRSGFQSNESSGATEFDSGVNFDEPDLSRFSAPTYSSATERPGPHKLDRMGKSFDEDTTPPSNGRVTLQQFQKSMGQSFQPPSPSSSRKGSKGTSLAEVQLKKDLYTLQKKQATRSGRRKTDSADSLLNGRSDIRHGRYPTTSAYPYDHLSPAAPAPPARVTRNPYDNLPKKMAGMSLQATSTGYSSRRQESAYDNF